MRSTVDTEIIEVVTLPNGASIGKFPITQQQWEWVALNLEPINLSLAKSPSEVWNPDNPVTDVSWDEAVEFCNRLTNHFGQVVRLPSEVEWEYACRAGTTTPFHFGETITTSLANFSPDEWGIGPTEVGSFSPNEFGLYDMHGNVWEWTGDHSPDGRKILKGGSWATPPEGCTWGARGLLPPGRRSHSAGFRVVVVE